MSKKIKPFIVVFWEGESEQVYTTFLKKRFEDVAIIKSHREDGLFQTATNVFKNDLRYRNSIDALDEIWFFFDTDTEKAAQWDDVLSKIKALRRLRKTGVRVRLLMTTACIEYWLLLHYERCAPSIATTADKERMKARVCGYVELYKKGDEATTHRIAVNYLIAIENGKWTLAQLIEDGLPSVEDSDRRNCWLFRGTHTFTTVHEAMEYLSTL